MYPHLELAMAGARIADQIRHAENRRAVSAARSRPRPHVPVWLSTALGRHPVAGTAR